MARKKTKNKRWSKSDRDYFINGILVFGTILGMGAYIMMRGCSAAEGASKPSPLEQKVQQVETVKPAERPYSISEVIYKN